MKIRIDPLTGMPVIVNEEVKVFSQSGAIIQQGGGGGGSVNSVTATNGTIVVNNTDPANPTVAVGTGIPESSVANLISDLAGKQATGNYITALTGDAIANGPGSAALTLASVVTGGSVGDATHIPVLTYDNKGRITSVTTATPSATAPTQRTFAFFVS